MTDPTPLIDQASDFQRYANGADKIQAKCACIRWDARECHRARHAEPLDDIERHSESWMDFLDDDCQCRCHDEIRELEEDIYGPPDDGL